MVQKFWLASTFGIAIAMVSPAMADEKAADFFLPEAKTNKLFSLHRPQVFLYREDASKLPALRPNLQLSKEYEKGRPALKHDLGNGAYAFAKGKHGVRLGVVVPFGPGN